MTEPKYLVRAPLLDPKQHVLGYKLAWQKSGHPGVPSGDPELCQLLGSIAERVSLSQLGLLFLEANPLVLSELALRPLSPPMTVMVLACADLAEPDNVASVRSLRERGFGLALRDADMAWLAANEKLLSLVTCVNVSDGNPRLAAIAGFARHRGAPLAVTIDHLPDWHAFDACASQGLNGFFANLCLKPRELGPARELGPQAVLILQLMQMVQDNADVRDLEKVLKRDATISYKLFRYINSPGFGIEVEIESLRHAVSMLGYTPLFRWLSVLLATTNTTGFSPALLQAAIVRGRFAELLGQGLLSRSESENLFFVGMFSLLDQLLGIPLKEVLSQILLPDAVVQALLSREGVYGPFLSLVEACEQEDGCASDIADALFMTRARVNQAHVVALAWAHTLKI